MRTLLALLLILVALPMQADRRGILLSKKTSAAGGGGGPTFPTGATAFWKLGEAAGNNRVDFYTGNDLVENGGTVGSRTGAVGDAADFVPADFNWLEVADSADISMGADVDFSISFWFRSDAAPSFHYIFAKDNAGGSTPEYEMRLLTDGGALRFTLFSSGGVATPFDTTATFTSGVTYHVVVTYDQSNIKTYVNGSLDSTQANTTDCRDTTSPLAIGTSLGNGTWFDGFVDALGIWQRALSLSEVQDLYNSGAGLEP